MANDNREIDHDREYRRQLFEDNFLTSNYLIAFSEAAFSFASEMFISLGQAQQALRDVCASGRVRSYRDNKKQIKRKEWMDSEPDLDEDVKLNDRDVLLWILQERREREPPSIDPALAERMEKAQAIRGLQPLLIRLLTELFDNKPVPDKEKREALLQTLRERHEQLRKLDHATLKIAIERYNRTF